MKAPADCRARGPACIRPQRIDHHIRAVFVVLAEVAVHIAHQHQDNDRTSRQIAADLQAAVVNHPLGGVGVHREHRHVLIRLADLHRHGEHGSGNGVLRGSHPVNLERVLIAPQ